MVWKILANVASFYLYFQRFKVLVGCWQECSFLNLITCDNFFEYLVKYITPNSVLQNSIEWLHVTFPGLFYNIIASIVVCLGCHDKIWETKGLREQKFIFSQFWKLQVQAQGVSRFGFSWDLFLWFADDGLVFTWSFFVYMHPWGLFLCPNTSWYSFKDTSQNNGFI